MIFIGIDPGLSGGVAVLDEQANVLLVEEMPVRASPVKGKKMVDALELHRLLQPVLDRPARCAIERVGSMPRQGIASAFSFGTSYGIAIGVISACRIGLTLVSPQDWKRYHRLSADKAQAVGLASSRWPLVSIRHTDDGLAEALLIADWLRTH